MEIKAISTILLCLQWLTLGIQIGIGIMQDKMRDLDVMTPEMEKKYTQWKVVCLGIILIIMIVLLII